MTIQETLDFLMGVRTINSKIRKTALMMRELEANLLTATTRYAQDRVQTSPVDQMGEIMAQIDTYEREIAALKERKKDLADEISDAINHLDDEREKTVLTLYYVKCKSMDSAAEALNYSRRSVYYIRRNGVANLRCYLDTRG